MYLLELRFFYIRITSTGGRNHFGHISTKNRGAGEKKIYRFLDFNRRVFPQKEFKLIQILRVTSHTAIAGLFKLPQGFLVLTTVPEKTCLTLTNIMTNWGIYKNIWQSKLRECNQINLANNIFRVGYSGLGSKLPLGSIIYNIEILPGTGAKLVRSAGTSAVLLAKRKFTKRIVIRLRTGELRLVHRASVACLGSVSNSEHHTQKFKNAGEVRRRGFRPSVRASAMNPVDHPMGGRTKGGCPAVSKKGKLSVGPSTRKLAITNTMILIGRKEAKRRGRNS